MNHSFSYPARNGTNGVPALDLSKIIPHQSVKEQKASVNRLHEGKKAEVGYKLKHFKP